MRNRQKTKTGNDQKDKTKMAEICGAQPFYRQSPTVWVLSKTQKKRNHPRNTSDVLEGALPIQLRHRQVHRFVWRSSETKGEMNLKGIVEHTGSLHEHGKLLDRRYMQCKRSSHPFWREIVSSIEIILERKNNG